MCVATDDVGVGVASADVGVVGGGVATDDVGVVGGGGVATNDVGVGGGGFGGGVCSWYRCLASRNPIYSHSRSNLW